MGIKIECPYCKSKKTNIWAVVDSMFNIGRKNYDVFCNSCGEHFALVTAAPHKEVKTND